MDTVIVFDFDLTIIDCDSDPWVMEQLGLTQLFDSLLPTIPWNPLMDKMMGELHEQGKTISDIEASLRTIPLYPETIRAIKFAFSLGCDLRIVSDANIFFIKTILETHDLVQYFTEIKANPAHIEENGRLRICPFHPYTVSPHGCSLCPPNMCKGGVIEEMRKAIEDVSNKRFIYLGDGSGDFCPSLKLREGDFVLPRKEYPLWKLIEKHPDRVKAQVHGWSDAKDMEDLLKELLRPGTVNCSMRCRLTVFDPHNGANCSALFVRHLIPSPNFLGSIPSARFVPPLRPRQKKVHYHVRRFILAPKIVTISTNIYSRGRLLQICS